MFLFQGLIEIIKIINRKNPLNYFNYCNFSMLGKSGDFQNNYFLIVLSFFSILIIFSLESSQIIKINKKIAAFPIIFYYFNYLAVFHGIMK